MKLGMLLERITPAAHPDCTMSRHCHLSGVGPHNHRRHMSVFGKDGATHFVLLSIFLKRLRCCALGLPIQRACPFTYTAIGALMAGCGS